MAAVLVNRDSNSMWVVSFTLRQLCLQERVLPYPFSRMLGTSELARTHKRVDHLPCVISVPDSSVVQSVTTFSRFPLSTMVKVAEVWSHMFTPIYFKLEVLRGATPHSRWLSELYKARRGMSRTIRE